jgi:hypothetical protein
MKSPGTPLIRRTLRLAAIGTFSWTLRAFPKSVPSSTGPLSQEDLKTSLATENFKKWLQQSPWNAAVWISRQPDATDQDAHLVADRLQDPSVLNAYCDQLRNGVWKQIFLSRATESMQHRNRTEALALAQRLDPGFRQTWEFKNITFEWLGKDPDAALAWISALNNASLREELIADAAGTISRTNPKRAAELLIGVKSAELFKQDGLILVGYWLDKSPAEAAAWVAHLPPGEMRKTAVNHVLFRWLPTEPTAAERWIRNLPERDAILKAIQISQTTHHNVTAPFAPPRPTGPTYSTGGLDRPIDDPKH